MINDFFCITYNKAQGYLLSVESSIQENNKWQAAIKVEKKRIHLGTVTSQQEDAHLYDRAAFMCGREPNFELSDEEKT